MSKRRPSAAMIVAVIALVLGLGGAAIAADLTKPQVKKIAKKVANKQIKKKAILKSQEGSLNVNSAKTAGTATTAGSADSVDGVSAGGINYRVDATGAETTILNLGGLQFVASCPGGSLALEARTTVNDSALRGFAYNNNQAPPLIENDVRDENFDVGDTVNLVPDDDSDHQGFLQFSGNLSAAAGSNVSVDYHLDSGGSFDCVVTGHALQSG